jgi:hypothetical protein
MTLIFVLGRKWGLEQMNSLMAALTFTYLHWALGYDTYIGSGLIEHSSVLAMCILFFLFSRHSYSNSRWTVALACVVGFAGMSLRPNFMPWYLVSLTGLLSRQDATVYRKFVKQVMRHKGKLILFTVVLLAEIYLIMFRNYLVCGQFAYISAYARGLYNLPSDYDRLVSLWAMASLTAPNEYTFQHETRLYVFFGSFPLIGWLIAVIGTFIRKGGLKRFPIPLGLIAISGAILHYYKYNILVGYGVRWALPLFPFWVLSLFFGISIFSSYIKKWLPKIFDSPSV